MSFLRVGTEKVKEASMEAQKEAYDPKKDREEQKIDLYTDQRVQRVREDDNMSNLDAEDLERIIHEKYGTNVFTTEIVCKHFITAVENKTYGWFWICPNGGDRCKYRHCLPPDYVFKSDIPKEVVENEETLEERIERLRSELPPGGEMVTAESLQKWRQEREQGRIETLKETMAKDKSTQLTGKDLFMFNPSLFLDDDAAAADLDDYEHDDVDIDEIIRQNEEAIKTGNVMPDDYNESTYDTSTDNLASEEKKDLSDVKPSKPQEATSDTQQSPKSSKETLAAAPKFDFGQKKKKKRPVDTTETEIIDGTGALFVRGHVYPYEELLARIQTMINQNNPDLTGSKRYTLKPPQVVRVGSKKVAWINFKDLCRIMGRSIDHVHQFVLAELGTEGSIAGDGQLVLKGKYGPKNIESLLRKYISRLIYCVCIAAEYVTCSMCKSPNTTMERDARARLFTQHCEACGANRLVNVALKL
ncbi:bifunctional Translation initiation factor IF2-IF5 domain/Zinc finger [Babesia duncani]|uniref:Bifunctional Translation initiation factor IF2-IF5 domain/Zinc finger n=1 Tax=Babesia duncani TaxID=323732 RepID=A0AAD9UN46_9APIC|nr:bifunctional Translation initiation factor IF2-IF5 domain/Zinc finger [Babesia duncani]